MGDQVGGTTTPPTLVVLACHLQAWVTWIFLSPAGVHTPAPSPAPGEVAPSRGTVDRTCLAVGWEGPLRVPSHPLISQKSSSSH